MPKRQYTKEFSFSESRARRREIGVCIECGDEATRLRCNKCLLKNRESVERYIKKKNSLGICRYCDKPLEEGFVTCNECKVKTTAESKVRREKRIADNKCNVCGKDAELNEQSMKGEIQRFPWCEHCWLKTAANRALGSTKHWKILLDKLEACNWKCPYTGETLVLGVNVSFDHVDPVCRFPERRYDPSNVEVVSWQVNMMKSGLTKGEFLAMVGKIHSYVNNK